MARLMIVPGLHDSEPDHWQSWLRRWVVAQEQWLARQQRPQRASLLEWSFAV